jgi:hypothetical protein
MMDGQLEARSGQQPSLSMIFRGLGIVSCLLGILLILFGGIKTAENFRIVSDFLQNSLEHNHVLFLFLPDDNKLKIAMIIGLLTMLIDFILETVAVYLDWWYPLGGTQFPPLIVVPLEMVLSFFLIGTTMAIILDFPEKIRTSSFFALKLIKPFFKNNRLDWFWRFLLVLLNAIIGMNGDYSAGPEIWAPGPSWNPIYTFFVWLGGGFVTLLFYYLLNKKFSPSD